MQKYKSNITTTSGAAVRGVPVHVLDESGNPAAIFMDRAGAVPSPNPLSTAADGTFYFYAVNGRYSLRTTLDGVTITDADVVLLMDPEEITVAGPIADAVALAQDAAQRAEDAVANAGIPILITSAQNAAVDAGQYAAAAGVSAAASSDSAAAALASKNAAQAIATTFGDVQGAVDAAAAQANLATTNGQTQVALATEQVTLAAAQAVIATDQAGVASAQAGISGTKAAEAQTAKVAAESARDAANAVGKVFTSTALGIAGTTSGQSFSVLSTDLQDLIVYTNSSGAETELFRFKTKAFLDSLGFDTTYASRIGYAAAWLDSTGAMALGIRNDGHIIFGHGGDIVASIDTITAALASAPTQADAVFNRSGYVWAWLDSLGNLAGGLDVAGNLISKGKNLSSQAIISQAALDSMTASVALNSKWITPSPNLACWGDSLTQGSYPSQLGTLMGRTVFNGGAGGQGASSIAARQGGLVPLITLTGNLIPAGTSTVVVSAITVNPLNFASAQTITGTVLGIPCTLTRVAADESYTFARNTAGTAKAVDPATPFIVTQVGHEFETVIIWSGRNGATYGDSANIKTQIANMVAFLKPQDKRFAVLSVINADTESPGTSAWTAITQLNTDLKTLYPNNYVEVRRPLVRAYNPALPQDVIDFGNDIPPTSLRTDNIHLTDAGYAVVANCVKDFLTEKGW